ncbi:MAG: response regulator [Nitrospirales bacterium]|nr:response regulator [Nitrospirales bacterium]
MANKLLLADDSLTIQKVVELVLVHEDFEIRAVNDGEAALETLGTFRPDIVLADIDMPKLNGYQLCEKIKGEFATADIPVILLAGAFEPFDEEYAKTVGADDFIIKPFESQELISKVKSLLVSSPSSPARGPEEVQEEAVSFASLSEIPGAPFAIVGEPSAGNDSLIWEDTAASPREDAGQGFSDEEYEAKVALLSEGTSFEAELQDAMRAGDMPAEARKIPPADTLPPKQELSDTIRETIERRVSEALAGEVALVLAPSIREAAERVLADCAPGIVESVTRDLLKDLLHSLRGEIHAAIGKIVPEVAETIIRKEIEKITAEL